PCDRRRGARFRPRERADARPDRRLCDRSRRLPPPRAAPAAGHRPRRRRRSRRTASGAGPRMTAADLLVEAVARRDAGRSADAHALAAEALLASAGEDSRTVEALLLLGRTSLDLCAYD